MKIKITISRSVFEWIYYDVFETFELMADARISLHPKSEVEYWVNVIVKHVLLQVCKKFSVKENTASKTTTINLEVAEAYTLYRFLHNYPINETEYWKIIQRNKIIEQIHAQIEAPVNTVKP